MIKLTQVVVSIDPLEIQVFKQADGFYQSGRPALKGNQPAFRKFLAKYFF